MPFSIPNRFLPAILFGVQVLPSAVLVWILEVQHPVYQLFPVLLLVLSLVFIHPAISLSPFRLIPPIAYFGLISLLSSVHPGPKKSVRGFLFHPVEFFFFAILVGWTISSNPRKSPLRVFLQILFVGLLAAIADEVHQYFVPGRYGDPRDVLLDMSGVFTGAFAWFILTKMGYFHEKKSSIQ